MAVRAGATLSVKSDTLKSKRLQKILIPDKYTFNQQGEMRNQNHQPAAYLHPYEEHTK